MPNCTAEQMSFGRLGRRQIEANFEGGALSSDSGLMLLRQVDRRIGLSRAVAMALHDPRNQDRITHELHDLADLLGNTGVHSDTEHSQIMTICGLSSVPTFSRWGRITS